jgi:UDP-glucose 4-epimerase
VTERSRKVLVTGADTFWGARVLRALEGDPAVEMLLGLTSSAPAATFERTELVRAEPTYGVLSRVVRASQVDTVIHPCMIVDSAHASAREIHEANVIGTMNLLAAAGTSGSSVRQLVVKSSSLVYGSSEGDPATFREETPRAGVPQTDVERSLIEAEGLVRDFAQDNPSAAVALLRVSDVLGAGVVSSITKNLSRRACPCVGGFDPLVQFVHEDDVVRAVELAVRGRLDGTYNVAGPGRLPWSEVAATCGTRRLPLPPVCPALAVAPLARLGVFDFPPELGALLRYGRAMDTSRLVAAGFEYRYTSAGAVHCFARHLRLARRARRSLNAGIEPPQQRRSRGTPARGRRRGPRHEP